MSKLATLGAIEEMAASVDKKADLFPEPLGDVFRALSSDALDVARLTSLTADDDLVARRTHCELALARLARMGSTLRRHLELLSAASRGDTRDE